MSLFRTSLSVLATEAAAVPLGLANSILLARCLSTEDRGIYALAVTLSFVVIQLSQLGWGNSSIYQLRRGLIPPPRVAGIALGALLATSAVVIALVLPLRPFIVTRFIPDAPSIVFYLMLCLVPIQLAAISFRGIARGIGRFDIQNWFRVLALFGTLLAFLFVFGVMHAGVTGALGAYAGATALAALGLIGVVTSRTGVRLRGRLAEYLSTARFGLRSWGLAIAGRVHESIDVIMLGALLQDPSQVAIYAISVGIVERLKMVPEALAMSAFPELAALDARTATNLTSALLRHSATWVVLLLIPLALVVPPLIPPIWGSEYAASVGPFLVLLPAVACLAVSRVITRYFMALNRQDIPLALSGVSVVLNVSLNLWLIPRYGAVGAALASLASYGAQAAVIVSLFLRRSGAGLRSILILQGQDFDVYTTRVRAALRRLGLSSE